jgi:hypothetical protein
MRNKLFIAIGVLVFGCVVAFTANKARLNAAKNWDVNLFQNSKDPYGLYIAHQELGNLSNGKIIDLDNLSQLKIDPAKAKDYAVVVIGDEIYFDTIAKNLLVKLVKNGGTLFIADYYDNLGDDTKEPFAIDTVTTDSLDLDTIDDMLSTSEIDIMNDFELTTNQRFKIKKKKEISHHYFETTTSYSEQIGTLTINNKSFPNFLKIKSNSEKGTYYYHSEPLYFTNYYLLNQDSYFYTKSVLDPLKGKTILWYNTNKTYAGSSSIMRFIMAEPALRLAWFTLLGLLVFFLIFRSKREQRIIPIIEKEENHTVEFAKTISSLYQENGEVKDIITKKIEYFLHKLRKNFLIETTNITDKQFIEVVSQKANYTQEECLKHFETIKNIQQNPSPTQHDLNVLYKIIENYKQKANL